MAPTALFRYVHLQLNYAEERDPGMQDVIKAATLIVGNPTSANFSSEQFLRSSTAKCQPSDLSHKHQIFPRKFAIDFGKRKRGGGGFKDRLENFLKFIHLGEDVLKHPSCHERGAQSQ